MTPGWGAVLEALDAAADEVGEQRLRAAGHRLEHVEMADQSAIDRLAKYSVSVSVQPGFDAAWGQPGGLYEQRLGGRSQTMNPFASFYASGVPIAFGSDSLSPPLSARGRAYEPAWSTATRSKGSRLVPHS